MAACTPPGGVRPAPRLCAGLGPFTPAGGARPAYGDQGRPGAPSPQRPRNPGPALPTTLSPPPAPRLALEPTAPTPRQTLEAIANPLGPLATGAASRGPHPPEGGEQNRTKGKGLRGRGCGWSGNRSPHGPPDLRSPLPCRRRGPPGTCRTGSTETRPFHPLSEPEREEARPPEAGRPLVWQPRLGEGCRRILQPGAPCLPSPLPLWAVPQDVDLVLMRRPAMGAHRVGP